VEQLLGGEYSLVSCAALHFASVPDVAVVSVDQGVVFVVGGSVVV
jgi:hypothetical protein